MEEKGTMHVHLLTELTGNLYSEESDAEDMQGYGRMSHILLRRCRMVVVCGKEVTGTMNTEISMADRLLSLIHIWF